MAANDRYVRESAGGGWEVVKEGHRRATAHSSSKAGALAQARAMARREGGQVRLLRDGKIVPSKPAARPPRTAAA
jgi:Uncharacterized protein conserved in bacteria (DUF2188)